MMARLGQPGPPVGVGRSADVYDLGHGRVLRRYHDHARSARGEAEVMSWAAAHGVPVPEVFDVDGPDIVMEKVDEPTMLADAARRPWRLARHAASLARLHGQVHAVPALDWLGAPFGDGGALLHLDLHPENVLLSARGPVVIDWEGAARGPAEADVALCWVVVATSEVPGSVWQRAVGLAGQRHGSSRWGCSSTVSALMLPRRSCWRSPPVTPSSRSPLARSDRASSASAQRPAGPGR